MTDSEKILRLALALGSLIEAVKLGPDQSTKKGQIAYDENLDNAQRRIDQILND